MLETVIKGVAKNEKVYDSNKDIVRDTSDVKLMQTLFSHKRLEIKDRGLL